MLSLSAVNVGPRASALMVGLHVSLIAQYTSARLGDAGLGAIKAEKQEGTRALVVDFLSFAFPLPSRSHHYLFYTAVATICLFASVPLYPLNL